MTREGRLLTVMAVARPLLEQALRRGPHGTRRRVKALFRRLERAYGPFEPKAPLEPLDELILTILSQATSDRNSLGAFRQLKERFPTWEEVRRAPRQEVERAIRSGGLARNKSKVIQDVLTTLGDRDDGFQLEGLAEAPIPDALRNLTSLPGVGTKTAACVLMFGFGRPVMPVDTHVHRLSRRLGLVTERATPDQTHDVLMCITPEEQVYPFHVWLIAHGRAICRAQRPQCDACELVSLCPSSELS